MRSPPPRFFVYWRRGRPEAGRQLIDLLSPDGILAVVGTDVRRAAELLGVLRAAGLSPRDCVHVAVMERAGIERIITTDADFDRVPGIVRLDPASFG